MRSYTLIAPAKINLYLEILGDRPDGYHELAMVMQTIDLADRIHLRSNGTDVIRIHCNHPGVPQDKTNLAYRAAVLMTKQFPNAFAQYGGVEIEIDKHIPIAAGLAGGSTDAASVLVGLDLMWNLGLTQSELQELAAQLGSDVPFCVTGGTAIATGRGEKLAPLPDLDKIYVILAKYRHLEVSTAWAYSTYRKQFGNTYACDTQSIEARSAKVNSGCLVSAIAHKDNAKIGECLYNDLEKVVLPTYPQVLQLREAFQRTGVLGTMMSGSGPTVFALSESLDRANQIKKEVANAISDPDLDFWIAQFTPSGIGVAN
ncbi:4-(cytidine 5'-diphospho)-2-C-methyl-D-erythritol kinase [Planktothrix sp. FACHB-1355]|uniref:4-diphosphocytidyl-2-C-methyl-D-erythritol kinase n=1 Tax=Aerosakkonema funiforme FACHB-1375 TaxID=2949571 RepID=A0A926VBN9_9CYAN|nr:MULTISPECIES: 4-(cytidine 5'-diphospho)-2-C-methyl-D-erythritol kinase [Oscillatoriales]MBD2180393.1 4-(cytidine 5'-diphospho)-2-C-methyl-D-erythritol kinase [Aerosakkonema funiforme FACHB-1375]MBD3558107.1 4-(cytidine 5'-diphospho)-2-C-methyl-D-erythritol kinase [Planktothrix sp. FACHB-1355]